MIDKRPAYVARVDGNLLLIIGFDFEWMKRVFEACLIWPHFRPFHSERFA
jgi:hypothetical protein